MRQSTWGPLRFRVPAIVVALFLLLAGILVRGMQYTETRRLASVESQGVTQDVRRATAALDVQEDDVRAAAGSRMLRACAVASLGERDGQAGVSSVTTATLRELGVDFVACVDDAGRVKGAMTAWSATPDAGMTRALASLAAVVSTSDPAAVYSGAMLVPLGPAVVAATPVRAGAGVPAGVLVVGTVLDSEAVVRIESLTLLDVQVRAPRAGEASGSDEPDEIYVDQSDPRLATGRITVQGLDGRPALRMQVTERRNEFVNAKGTLEYASWAILGLVLLFGFGMYAILDLMVLGRMTQLHRELSAIGSAQSSPRRVTIRGSDEIAEVSTAINATLERLEAAEEALQHAAHHDYLTDLENRRGFEREAVRELAERSRAGGHCSLILLDIDDFKLVNDTHGHLSGDRVLVQFARILRASMRAYSTVARLGGDEFAVLLPHADRDEAMVALGRLNEALSSAVWEATDGAIVVAATAGVAVSPDDGETLDELMASADSMLYAWKTEKQADAPER